MTSSSASPTILHEILRLAGSVGELKGQHIALKERVVCTDRRVGVLEQRVTALEHPYSSSIQPADGDSGSGPMPLPQTTLGEKMHKLHRMSEAVSFLVTAYKTLRHVPWGLVAAGAVAAWKYFWPGWPLLARWLGL
jgi:hypothetical protein